ncbi:hypothetical protein DPMN_068113 [Dreissena polymorpha]|uniref:Uncharacterized protein n=1 Tax=Dreissena polymorpha TaxID=45954 RepID=A0A9D3Z0H8_DREPO|nr:hypothetical protein DPMN_068113 [Dreissena polymorpha]
MYYGLEDNKLGFRREEYDRYVRTMLWEDAQFFVSRTISTSHQALVKVVSAAK